MIWWRIAHVPVILIPALFYHFVTIFIELRSPRGIALAYMGSVGFLIADTTPFFISNVRKVFGQFYYDSPPGILYPWFFLFYAVVVFISCFELWRFLKRSDRGLRLIQVRWFFVATAIGFTGSILCFPPVFGIDIYPYGNFIIPLCPILVTYAIVRHQLMDIVVVIKRSMVYSILIACITAAYMVMVLVTEKWFQGVLGYRSLIGSVMVGFAVALGFTPLKELVQRVIDRIFFHNSPLALAEENERLRQELTRSERLKAVSTLAAGMAHEIKNPLSVIKTFSEFLPERYTDPEFREKFTRLVTHEVHKINDLVQRLLDFAKPIPPRRRPTRLSRLIDDTLEFLDEALVRKQIRIVRAYAVSDAALVDPSQIRQVLLNVLLNSIEAMEKPGTITISTLGVNGHLEIQIADTGPGIPKERLGQVFDPFFTTKATGTGLGLSVVHSIVTEHGGRVTLSSALGQGTTVRMQLPIAKEEDADEQETARADRG